MLKLRTPLDVIVYLKICVFLVAINSNTRLYLQAGDSFAKMPDHKKYCALAPIKATIVRLVFAVHSLVSIYRVVEAYQNPYYWLLLLSLLGLILETVLTLIYRAGNEWTWFSPAIFCYLIAALPSIWLLEIQLSTLRVQPRNVSENASNGDQLTNTICCYLQIIVTIFFSKRCIEGIADPHKILYPTYSGKVQKYSIFFFSLIHVLQNRWPIGLYVLSLISQSTFLGSSDEVSVK